MSHQAIQKRAKDEGWGDGKEVGDAVRRKVAEKVAGVVAGCNPWGDGAKRYHEQTHGVTWARDIRGYIEESMSILLTETEAYAASNRRPVGDYPCRERGGGDVP